MARHAAIGILASGGGTLRLAWPGVGGGLGLSACCFLRYSAQSAARSLGGICCHLLGAIEEPGGGDSSPGLGGGCGGAAGPVAPACAGGGLSGGLSWPAPVLMLPEASVLPGECAPGSVG